MKLLIVGLGSMGKRRANLIKSISGTYRISGVDSNASRRSAGDYATLEEALQAGKYDAAFVCTSPLSHAKIIHALLDANLPVFTELNLVSTDYRALMQKARQKNLTLFLSNTMLYRAETQAITRAVHKFGKPVHYIYHIGQYLPDWHPWEDYRQFFASDARTSAIREILCIEFPWLVTAFGDITAHTAAQDRLSALEIDYPDSLSLLLRHKNEVRGILAVDVVSPKAVRNFEVYGEGLHLFWEGNPKSLYAWDSKSKEKQPVDTYSAYEQDSRYSDNIVENAYLDEIKNFFAVLKGQEKPRWSFEQDEKIIHFIDTVEKQP